MLILEYLTKYSKISYVYETIKYLHINILQNFHLKLVCLLGL